MKKNRQLYLTHHLRLLCNGLFLFLKRIPAVARADSLPSVTILHVFAPLYLDSAFDATGQYRYAKSFPKFINPGLEFWEGAQLAIDSMKKEGLQLEVHVYDTRAANTTIDVSPANARK